jgi:2-octaprenyl-6-methoxyphenol hydroxylase|tara:strand:+ start:8436 stop:9623 length:1188 start_codon:yes stop_codon:yes gene_type:complete
MSDCSTDIVIIGGGLAGAALALLLRKRRAVSVTLVEAVPLPISNEVPFTPSFDARSTALSAGTLAIFSQLGIVDALLPYAADIDVVHVSRRGRPGFAEISASEENLSRLGAVVENRWLGRVLLNAVRADSGITVIAPDKAVALTRLEAGYKVCLESGTELVCRLLVAADGAESKTRDMLGVGAEHHDTGHAALIANIGLSQPHKGRAYERFVEDGPLAMLPMTDDRSALIWTGPRARIEHLLALSATDFLAQVQEQFGQRLGTLKSAGERVTYPLILTRTFAQALPHAVIVGNAAHTLHPVAGQGFNLTLRDLHLLADKVCAAPNIGELAPLQAYVDARVSDQALISRVSHWLPSFFRIQTGAVSHLRQLGLIAFDMLPAVRSRFARKAMGFAND